MALTAKRREELAKEIDTASTWMSNRGRSGKLRAIAAELRGEDVDDNDDTEQTDKDRLEAAEKAEREAQEAKAARRGPTRPAADA